MTLEEFKKAFSSEARPKVICTSTQEQADTYEFLLRVGYDLGPWERNFLNHDEQRREEDRRDYQYPRRSAVYADKACTNNNKPTEDDIWFSDIEDLIRGDKTEPPDLDKLFGGF